MISIFIADNDSVRRKIYRQAFRQVFEPNKPISYNLTETYTDLEEQLKNKKSDIAIIYLHSLTQNEIDFLYRMKFQNPNASIILIIEPNNSKKIFRYTEIGITDYLFIPFSVSELKAILNQLDLKGAKPSA